MIPSIPPGNLRATMVDGHVILHWMGTAAASDQFYRIYRRTEERWQPIGEVPVTGDNRGDYTFQDPTAKPKSTYHYAIASIDHYGNESPRSEEVTLTVE